MKSSTQGISRENEYILQFLAKNYQRAFTSVKDLFSFKLYDDSNLAQETFDKEIISNNGRVSVAATDNNLTE